MGTDRILHKAIISPRFGRYGLRKSRGESMPEIATKISTPGKNIYGCISESGNVCFRWLALMWFILQRIKNSLCLIGSAGM